MSEKVNDSKKHEVEKRKRRQQTAMQEKAEDGVTRSAFAGEEEVRSMYEHECLHKYVAGMEQLRVQSWKRRWEKAFFSDSA